jgi:hypothetical protein
MRIYEVRPLPPIRKTKALAVVIGFGAFTCAAVWLRLRFDADWIAGVPFLLAMPIGWFFFWTKRCPVCARRLQARKDGQDNSTKYMLFSRCDRCKVDWDTGIVGDTRHDD